MAGWYIGFGMLLVLTCGLDTPEIAKVGHDGPFAPGS